MREDGERVRAWKAAKEKEVAQLRQAERKQVLGDKMNLTLRLGCTSHLEPVLSREVGGHKDAAGLLHDFGVGGEVRDGPAHELGRLSLGQHLFG